MSRHDGFLSAVNALQSERSVEIIGEHGSGRTHLLNRVREHFVTLNWKVLSVRGSASFRHVPFAGLSLAGLPTPPQAGGASALAEGLRLLIDEVTPGRTLIVVDDVGDVDDHSWGLIAETISRAGVPACVTRLPQEPPRERRTLRPIFTIELEPLSYPELETALETRWSASIEPTTMSRLYVYAGGNVGVANLAVEAALRAGTVVIDDGVIRATGSLWVTTLRATAELLLERLTPDHAAALRSLSLLGPVDMETAARVVSDDVLLTLEAEGFIRVVRSGVRHMVTVNPPLVAEYFREQTPPMVRAVILARLDDSLHQGVIPLASAEPRDTPSHVRLIHEQIRMRTIRAREAWQEEPGIAQAAALLLALQADTTHITEEVEALASAVEHLPHSAREGADWQIVYWSHLARHRAQVPAALQGLAAAAEKYPAEEVRILATRLILQMSLDEVPEIEPFADIDLQALPEHARAVVLTARVGWHLITGDAVRAHELLGRFYDSDPAMALVAVPELEALRVYCQLALDNLEMASLIARQRLDEAHAEADGSKIRVYSYLYALCAVLSRRLEDAETVVAEATALGLPPGEAPLSYVGLTLMRAYFAVRKGQRTSMNQYLADLDETGLPDGTLPGQNRAFIHTRVALLDGDSETAARISRNAGDELWARGARLAAAHCYTESVHAHLAAEDWNHAKDRLEQIRSPLFARITAFYGALLDRSIDPVMAGVEALLAAGRRGEAAYHARAALRVLTDDSDPVRRARERLEEIVDAGPVTLARTGGPDLTPREREVADLVAVGLTNPMIAEALFLSVRTVESHVNRLMKKIGAKRRTDVREYLAAMDARL